MGKTASFDIETFCPIEELEKEDIEYLKGRRDYKSDEDFHRDLATNPYVSFMVSFSFFILEEGKAYVFYLGEEDVEEVSKINIGKEHIEAVYISISSELGLFESEGVLLQHLWERLEAFDTLITFYGKDFDMEFLKIRTIMHGFNSNAFYRYFYSKNANHIDLRDIFKVGKNNYSLNFISRRLKLPVDKGDMDGSKVRDAFLRREYKKVAEYNLRDAVLTGLLYEKVKNYLYHNHFLQLIRSAGFSEGRELIVYALEKNFLSGREASLLIDLCKGRAETGPSDKQIDFLKSLIETYQPDLRDVCTLLNQETIYKIVKSTRENIE